MAMQPLSPRNDFVFKRIFGDQRNVDILADFLQAVLDLPPEEYKSIVIVDPHLNPESEDDKAGILDVKIHTASGKIVNVEIQVEPYRAMRERVLFYTARLFADQMGTGDNYAAIRKVVSIVITDWDLIRENREYHNRYFLYDKDTGSRFTDLLEIHILELTKLPPQAERTPLANWLRFLKASTKEEFTMASHDSPAINKAVGVLMEFSEDEKIRLRAEMREKARRDEHARMEYIRYEILEEGLKEGLAKGMAQGVAQGMAKGMAEGRSKGLEEGRSKGLAEGHSKGRQDEMREVVRNAVRKNISLEMTAALLGVSIDEVKQMAAEIEA